ncbi:hypothetical protein SNE40_002171 [Patella caerulea]|uniref:Uncharacterized protein n=1 Tax=Patella caerulea TaxID=87958 RepID=A0AAN8K5A5_PATCE
MEHTITLATMLVLLLTAVTMLCKPTYGSDELNSLSMRLGRMLWPVKTAQTDKTGSTSKPFLRYRLLCWQD